MGDGGAGRTVHELSRVDPGHSTDAQLVDHIVREVRDRVFAGTLPVGSWLRQEAIAAEFAVSRTPVREALRELQARGIVSLLPNRGALVRGPTLKEIREAYAVRAELEGLAARLAASRVSAADLDQLRQAGDPGVDPRGDDWERANDLFHEVILAVAGNDRLRLMIADLHRAFPRSLTWGALLSRAGELAENAAQHRRIREALEAGDGEEARLRMIQHVAHAGSLVEAWFAGDGRAWSTEGGSVDAAEAARER